MPESKDILGYNGKEKGRVRTFKPARGNTSRGNYGSIGGKPKTDKHIKMVDKKVKRVSNKVMRHKSKNPGPAAYDRY